MVQALRRPLRRHACHLQSADAFPHATRCVDCSRLRMR
jgi:hypothetical protein